MAFDVAGNGIAVPGARRHAIGLCPPIEVLQLEGRFPETSQDLPPQAIAYAASQLGEEPTGWDAYPWDGRMAKYDWAEIRR